MQVKTRTSNRAASSNTYFTTIRAGFNTQRKRLLPENQFRRSGLLASSTEYLCSDAGQVRRLACIEAALGSVVDSVDILRVGFVLFTNAAAGATGARHPCQAQCPTRKIPKKKYK
jgi:hypothetical protein